MSSTSSNQAKIPVPPEWLREFAKRHRLRELSLFGSVLREDFRPDSDVDVLIELEQGQTMSIERFLAIRDGLEEMFGRPVDLVEKPLLRNPFRRGEILRTREVIYRAA